MAKSKQTDKPVKDAEALERIADAVEKLAGEVEIIRGILDRLQDDFAWALNNDVFHRETLHRKPGPPVHITSMPLDPLAPDWNERINRFGPEDIAETESESEKPDTLF